VLLANIILHSVFNFQSAESQQAAFHVSMT